MDTPITQTQDTDHVDSQYSQQDLDDMAVLDQRIDVAIEISRLQELAQKIEAEGTPEMKAKLKPFKEHYDGDVATLISKRTKQNFDNDVWQDVAKAGDEAKAKYRQNPDAYLTAEQRQEYWEKAYDKTVDEAQKLTHNLEQVLQQSDQPVPATESQPATQNNAPRRRLFNR